MREYTGWKERRAPLAASERHGEDREGCLFPRVRAQLRRASQALRQGNVLCGDFPRLSMSIGRDMMDRT